MDYSKIIAALPSSSVLAESLGLSGLDSPQQCVEQCKLVSGEITMLLREAGFNARWVQLSSMHKKMKNEHSNWDVMHPDIRVHYVTQIGNIFVDYTFKQFDPSVVVEFCSTEHLFVFENDVTDNLKWRPRALGSM